MPPSSNLSSRLHIDKVPGARRRGQSTGPATWQYHNRIFFFWFLVCFRNFQCPCLHNSVAPSARQRGQGSCPAAWYLLCWGVFPFRFLVFIGPLAAEPATPINLRSSGDSNIVEGSCTCIALTSAVWLQLHATQRQNLRNTFTFRHILGLICRKSYSVPANLTWYLHLGPVLGIVTHVSQWCMVG